MSWPLLTLIFSVTLVVTAAVLHTIAEVWERLKPLLHPQDHSELDEQTAQANARPLGNVTRGRFPHPVENTDEPPT